MEASDIDRTDVRKVRAYVRRNTNWWQFRQRRGGCGRYSGRRRSAIGHSERRSGRGPPCVPATVTAEIPGAAKERALATASPSTARPSPRRLDLGPFSLCPTRSTLGGQGREPRMTPCRGSRAGAGVATRPGRTTPHTSPPATVAPRARTLARLRRCQDLARRSSPPSRKTNVDLTTAALVAVAFIVGVCCGIGTERYREHRKHQRIKEQVEREIDVGRSGATKP